MRRLVPAGTPVLRVGGQALPDGVLMRAGDVWAVARRDGSVEVGRMPPQRWVRVPLLRVIAMLIPALSRGLQAMRPRRTDAAMPLRTRWALPIFVAAPLAVSTLVGRWLGAGPSWGWQSGVQAIVLVTAELAALRLVLPGAMWRYHGAEHKAVTAYERGVDLEDVDAVLACTRVHNRCGTNVVAVLVLACLLPMPDLGLGGIVAFVGLFAASVEVVSAAAKRPGARLSRLVLTPGRALQRHVTTSEPTREEQEVGLRALRVCLGMVAAGQAAEAALDAA